MSDWFQQSLTPPEVIEINARLGLIPSQNHVQWLVEAKDPRTGVMIAQKSMPHGSTTELVVHVERLAEALRALVYDVVEPF